MPANITVSLLLLIQVLFGINFSTSKLIVNELDPFVWSNLRFFVSGVILLIVTLLSGRKHPPKNKDFYLNCFQLSLLGMALGQSLFLFGLKYTTSINTSIITTIIPLLTLFIVVIRREEELSWQKLIGMTLGFFGVVFIRDITQIKFTGNSFIGDLLVFFGAFCFALYLSIGKNFLKKYDHLWVTTYMFLFSSFAMFIYNIPKLSSIHWPVMDGTLIAAMSFTIIGATLLTYYLNNLVLVHASSAQVALFIYLQPLIASLIGWYFLGEKISFRTLICFLLILSGVCVTLYKSNPAKRS